MSTILALYGSPRRKGNTAVLTREAVRGARETGAEVEEIILRDLKMSPCLEIYGCAKTGRCAIQDDFQPLYDKIVSCDGVILSSPIFFYAVSSHTKILMDRCQSFWVRKYWLKDAPRVDGPQHRKGLFISVGATKGRKLFDGALLSVRYFFDAIDMSLWASLLYRDLDFEGDVAKHPDYLQEAYQGGRGFAQALRA